MNLNGVLAVTPDGAWLYTRHRGWQPVPGAQPRPPCVPVTMRHEPVLPDEWSRR